MSTETPLPTVYVVDDNERLCDLLQRLLQDNGIRCETFHSAESFLADARPAAPGCLVLDIKMEGMSGLDLQSRLVTEGFELPILILTAHAQVNRVLQAWHNGSYEFLLKPVRNSVLLEKIQGAIRFSQEKLVRSKEMEGIRARMDTLTPRENEVLDLVVDGKPNKTIGAELGLSQKTVEVHRSHVMKKMRAASLPDLVRMVLVVRGERARSTTLRSGPVRPLEELDAETTL